MDDSQDRRQSQRIDVSWPIIVNTGTSRVKGETVNLSESGMSICCDDPLPLNEVFQISIVPPSRSLLKISGKILWADLSAIDDQDKAVGMGLCFVEISEEDRSFFRKHLSDPES